MTGWYRLTLTLYTLTSSCNTTCPLETLLPRRSSVNVDMLLDKDFDTSDLAGETLCANGTHYTTKEQGFLPKLMEKIYQDRTIYKKKMLAAKQQYEKTPTIELKKEIARCNNIQMARKIQLNSAYGAIGNEHFRYYKLEIAELHHTFWSTLYPMD